MIDSRWQEYCGMTEWAHFQKVSDSRRQCKMKRIQSISESVCLRIFKGQIQTIKSIEFIFMEVKLEHCSYIIFVLECKQDLLRFIVILLVFFSHY